MASVHHEDELNELKRSADFLHSAFLSMVRSIQRLEALQPRRPFNVLPLPRTKETAVPATRQGRDKIVAPAPSEAAIRPSTRRRETGEAVKAPRVHYGRRPSQQAVVESLIGEKWLGRVGFLILLIGLGFLVGSSHQENWISPRALVTLAAAAGALLVGMAPVLAKQRLAALGGTLLMGGAGLLDFAVAWGHDAHGLFSHGTALAVFGAIAAICSVVAFYLRMRWIAVLIFAGAFISPLGIALQAKSAATLTIYALSVSVLMLLVGRKGRVDAFRFVAWYGAASLLVTWLLTHPDVASFRAVLGVALLFYTLFQAESFTALKLKSPPRRLALIAHPNNLLIFATVVFFTRNAHPTFAGVFAVCAALTVWIVAGRIRGRDLAAQRMKRAMRIDGAIMIACFAPLQFGDHSMTAALAIQAIVAALLCRWLPGPGPAIFTTGLVVAAIAHVVGWDAFQDNLNTPSTWAHKFEFTWLAVLTVGVTLAAYLVSSCLVAGRIASAWEKRASGLLVVAGTVLTLYVFADQFDRYYATWWWLACGVFWCVAARRFPIAGLIAPLIMAAAAVKFIAWDTIGAGFDESWTNLRGPVRNREVLTGVLVSLSLIWTIPAIRRMPFTLVSKQRNRVLLLKATALAAAIVFTWTGTFEIIRVFMMERIRLRFVQPDLSMQVALSVFWSACATFLLIIGLVRFNQSLRIFAITLFGIAGLKVLMLDLAFLETLYRVVSCVALGLLMVFASLLYHRLAARVVMAA